MNTFEHSPFPDVYVPYIVYPDLDIWQEIRVMRLPMLTRWLVYRALFSY